MKWKSSMAYLVAILFGLATPDAVAYLDDPARAAGQDGAESASSTVAAYPAELHGTWLPPDISCATLDGAGSDAALVIRNDGLRGYEDVHLVRRVEDPRTGSDVRILVHLRAGSRATLDQHVVPSPGELVHAQRGECHPVLVVLDLARHADLHVVSSVSAPRRCGGPPPVPLRCRG